MRRAEKYSESAPLYAREPLRFSGVPVAQGAPIPDRPDRQRRVLFRTGKVTHRAPVPKVPATEDSLVTVETPSEQRKRRRS